MVFCEVVGRYGIVAEAGELYIVYPDEDGDDDAMLFVLLRDIDDVLYRAKGGAFVYPCTVDDEESFASIMVTRRPCSYWEIVAVVPDSLIDLQDGLYFVGNDRVCVASHDIPIAVDCAGRDGVEAGLEGLLLKPPVRGGCGGWSDY